MCITPCYTAVPCFCLIRLVPAAASRSKQSILAVMQIGCHLRSSRTGIHANTTPPASLNNGTRFVTVRLRTGASKKPSESGVPVVALSTAGRLAIGGDIRDSEVLGDDRGRY